MHKLFKALNKFNGNVFFAGSTDFGDVAFECDYQNRTLSYAFSPTPIFDVCVETESSYLVAFSNNLLGIYSGGSFISYIDTGISSVDKVVINTSSEYYFLSRSLNQLFKYNSGVIWSFNLPDYSLRYDGNIKLRESDGTVIYYNNSNLYVVRDSGLNAVILNSLGISGSGDLSVVIGNEFRPTYAYVRARTISGKDLDQSSSSSNSSSSLSSLSSSSDSSSSESSSSESSSSSTELRSSSSSSSSSTEWMTSSSSSSSVSSDSSYSVSSSSSSSNSSSSKSSSSSSSFGMAELSVINIYIQVNEDLVSSSSSSLSSGSVSSSSSSSTDGVVLNIENIYFEVQE